MGPNYSDLIYFSEVANTLNISRAAERLGITQPSLSLAIKRLESSIGTDLLIRSKSGVKLTKTGERFVQSSRELVLNWEKIKSNSLKKELKISGYYSLGCHISVAHYTLPYVLPQVMKKFTDLDLNLYHNLSRKVLEQIISFKIDIGLVVNPVKHPDLIINKVCSDKVQFWTHKNLNKSKSSVLIYDPELIQSQTMIKKLKKHSINISQHIKTSNLEVIRSLIEKNVGIGILPNRVATHSTKNVLRPLDSYPFFNDEICLIYRFDTLKTSAEKEFIKYLKQTLTKHFST